MRKKCVPVKEVGSSERMVMNAMIETMHQSKGVGLAAPQVGITQRFFVADVDDGPMVIINPEIVKRSGSCLLEEGCLCLPEVTIIVKRAEEITVNYTDENNQSMTLTCNGLLARVIQHETDHLDGVLIIDYATDEEKAQFGEQLERLKAQQKE
ncbi:MAG: peptide deformylase [Candidatus Omnitrophica bacterium]|nr:peptide deformylase [Candidatus Omnitrophota bacterium]